MIMVNLFYFTEEKKELEDSAESDNMVPMRVDEDEKYFVLKYYRSLVRFSRKSVEKIESNTNVKLEKEIERREKRERERKVKEE